MQPGKPFPKRNKFDYKGSFNHTLVIGGNQDKGGAAILMTKACMHAGSGWTTVATHESHVNAILTSLPEAMTVNLGTTFQLPKEFTFEKYNVIGIGPGMGSDKHSKVILKEVIGWNKRYVFDADAIRILAKHPLWIRQLKDASSVFTPHLGELRDLIGGFENENEMLEASKRWVDEFQQYLLIKGPYSFLLTPSGKIFFNTTGNPGLAKAGSGDVLTGMIAGSIARHDNIESGIRWGVYLHGLAADIAIKDVSAESLLPSTVINYISKAILSV
jgi:NAD(P)H-hydrate epimerase